MERGAEPPFEESHLPCLQNNTLILIEFYPSKNRQRSLLVQFPPAVVGGEDELVDLVLPPPQVDPAQLVEHLRPGLLIQDVPLSPHCPSHVHHQPHPRRHLLREVHADVLYKLGLEGGEPLPEFQEGLVELGQQGAVLPVDSPGVHLVVGLDDHPGEDLFEGGVHLEDGFLQNFQLLDVGLDLGLFFLFGPAPRQLLPLGLADVVEVYFVEVVLLLDVGVGGRVGKVALPAAAGEVSALGVSLCAPGRFLKFH